MKKTAFVCIILLLVIKFNVFAESGYLSAWGDNTYGQCDNIPVGNDFRAISTGGLHSLALRADGSLAAWGYNLYGQGEAVPGSDYFTIAAGGFFNMAMHSDGSVAAWGSDYWGQLNVPPVNDIVAIAAGGYHSLFLRADGIVLARGYNSYGQCDIPEGLANVVAISAGVFHSMALRSDGTVVVWGENWHGQCDVPEGLNEVVEISGGRQHSMALRSDGTVTAWGDNSYGQCDVPEGQYVSIAAGGKHSLAMRSDGTVAVFGSNSYGQCNIPGVQKFNAIAAGEDFSLAIVKLLPGIVNLSSSTIQFSDTIITEESAWIDIEIKNTGFANLTVNNVHFKNETSCFTYFYPNLNNEIAPNELNTIRVKFIPTALGTKRDTLFIESNAVNDPVIKISLSGTGLAAIPSVPQNLTIIMQGLQKSDALIQWDAVNTTIHGYSLTPDYYFVYMTNTGSVNAPYLYLGYTNSTQFIHEGVCMAENCMFYKVKAVKFYSRGDERSVLSNIRAGMTEEEVMQMVLGFRY